MSLAQASPTIDIPPRPEASVPPVTSRFFLHRRDGKVEVLKISIVGGTGVAELYVRNGPDPLTGLPIWRKTGVDVNPSMIVRFVLEGEEVEDLIKMTQRVGGVA